MVKISSRIFLVSLCFSPSLWAAVPPTSLSPDALRQNLANALAVPLTQIVEAKAYRIDGKGAVTGFVLGRYRQATQAFTFPVLSVYYACDAGTCQASLRLGQAAERLAPLVLVDLDAPLRSVGRLEPVWFDGGAWQAASAPRVPVLLVASDVQGKEPSASGRGVSDLSEGTRSEHLLHVISLATPNAPTLLYRGTLYERWPDRAEDRARPPRRVGRRIESLSIGKSGSEHLLVISERDQDSRFSRGLRPSPESQTLRLQDGRFQPVAPASGPALLPGP